MSPSIRARTVCVQVVSMNALAVTRPGSIRILDLIREQGNAPGVNTKGIVVPQSHEQRVYWAKRRQRERWAAAQLPKPHPVRLLATSPEEYAKLQAEYPNMPITLDTSGIEQKQLFDTKEMIDV